MVTMKNKSIWHTAAETPKAERYFIEHYKVVVDDNVYWKYGLFKEVSDYYNPFDQDTARWCYLDDLLALEAELDRTRKELDIRKKQVEIANKAFDFINTEWDNPDCSRKELGACAFNAKEDIAGWESDIETALEQKDK